MDPNDLEGMVVYLENPEAGIRKEAAAILDRMGLSPALRAEALASRLWNISPAYSLAKSSSSFPLTYSLVTWSI